VEIGMSKRRFSVTLTTPYVERMNQLVEAGFYLDNQEIIRIALRRLFDYQGIPLTIEEVSQ